MFACGNDKHSHTLIKVTEKYSPCTQGEYDGYYFCTECEKVFTDAACTQETTLDIALGHDWSGSCDTLCNREGCNETRVADSHTDTDENNACDVCNSLVEFQLGDNEKQDTELPKDEFE